MLAGVPPGDLMNDGHQIIDKISHHAKTSIDDAVEGAEETLNKAGDDLVDAVRSKTDEVVNDAG
jgi:hypothetical protein